MEKKCHAVEYGDQTDFSDWSERTHDPKIVSSIFEQGNAIEQISAQRMRKLAKRDKVFVAMIRTIENEEMNKKTVTVNEEKTITTFLEQVQAILDEFSDVFLKDLPGGLTLLRQLDHRIELVIGAKPPHKAPYRMSPQGLDELKK